MFRHAFAFQIPGKHTHMYCLLMFMRAHWELALQKKNPLSICKENPSLHVCHNTMHVPIYCATPQETTVLVRTFYWQPSCVCPAGKILTMQVDTKLTWIRSESVTVCLIYDTSVNHQQGRRAALAANCSTISCFKTEVSLCHNNATVV